MNGFWFVVGSMLVYDMVINERRIAARHAKSYQKQKSKVGELKRIIRNVRKESNQG